MMLTETPKELISFLEHCQEKILNNFWFYDVGFSYRIEAPYSDRATITLIVTVGNITLCTTITYLEVFNMISSEYLIDDLIKKINTYIDIGSTSV